jgi:RNA 3'-terminal phosphate cyclase
MMPLGGGEISFRMNPVKKLKTLQLSNHGMVKRIRGVVYACKVSPTFANRTVEASKGIMLSFLPDVYIHTDQNKGKLSGLSSGFGINLSAETTDGVVYAAESVATTQGTLPVDHDALYGARPQKCFEGRRWSIVAIQHRLPPAPPRLLRNHIQA